MSTLVSLDGWAMVRSDAATPPSSSEWREISGPMTVAAALRAAGEWSFDTPRNFDEETWWFRARLPALRDGDRLHLDGLATLAEVFVDAKSVLRSSNMFHAHVVVLSASASSTLYLRFSPIARDLEQKRPRPRWKTRLASHQQLRWIRTSLAGRMPGWSPPVAPVGPWRGVWLERAELPAPDPSTERDISKYQLEQTGERGSFVPAVETVRSPPPARVSSRAQDVRLRAVVENGVGVVEVRVPRTLLARPLSLQPLSSSYESSPGTLVVGLFRADLREPTLGPSSQSFILTPPSPVAAAIRPSTPPVPDRDMLVARLEIPDPELWWPHTHGPQPQYPVRLEIGAEILDLGSIAFRTIGLDTTSSRFAISINGTPVFCRGACWTSVDIVTLTASPEEYRRVLTTVKEAGFNMLRLTGTLFYEDDAFYALCDDLGILVWQDFMFANMDYPIDDPEFRASVEREAREFLARVESRACLAMFCGGSEVEQQAAMFGAARELWRSSLFADVLPSLVSEIRPDVPYWPNSPSGGALPFHVDSGASHYYGVGAYLRPFADARRANVKFASECLAFANVPEDDLFPLFLGDNQAPFVNQKWKERTSKDNGSGWDFEDVRDHYVGRLFGVDPTRVRSEDMERYLALSRVAAGETMLRTFAEFRRADSPTMGALVWFLQDLWPGAGWGLLDSRGEPKSVYWYAKRALGPTALFILDEGVNGLHVHLVNDSAQAIPGTLQIALYRDGETPTNGGTQEIVVPPRSTLALAADAILPTFSDTAHAYRFGPSGHDVAIATWMQGETLVAESCFLVDFAKPPPCVGLEGTLSPTHVTVTTKRFAQAVKIVVPGHVAADNYFDLAPGRSRTIALRPMPSAKKRPSLIGTISALNARGEVTLR